MANNPFGEMANSVASPFENIQTEVPTPTGGLSERSVDRTARMAAIANGTVDTYNSLTSMYVDHIQQYGDDAIRTEIATKQQEDEFRALSKVVSNADLKFDPTGELRQGARLAAAHTINETIERRKEYALEAEALKSIQDYAADGDYTQAKVLMNLIEHGSADKVINDINVKRMIISREVEKAQVNVDDQPWFRTAVDFVMSAVGDMTFNNSLDRNNIVEIDKGMKNWYDWLFSGQRYRNEASALWSMNPADFAKAIREQVIPRVKDHSSFVGYTSNTQTLNLLSGLQDSPKVWEQNFTDGVVLAGFIPYGKIGSVAGTMLRAGARKQTADLLADTSLLSIRNGAAQAEKLTGITTGELAEHTIPTAMNSNGPEVLVPATGDTMAAIARGKALLAKMGEWTQVGRMTDAEMAEAIAKERQALNLEIGRPLKDFSIDDVALSDGSSTKRFNFLLGKKKGGGFVSEDSARSEATRMGISEARLVQDETGQWFIKESRDLNESGYYTTNLNPGLSRTGILGRIFLGNRQIDDEILAGQSRASANTRNKLVKSFYDTFHKDLASVSGQDKEFLQSAMAWGENESTWLSRGELDELFKRQGATQPAPDSVWKAYTAARDVNDIEYVLRNDVEWKRRAVKGFETVSISHPAFKGGRLDRENALIGRVTAVPPGGGKTRIFDLETGRHYHKNNPLTPDRFKDMIDDGYVLISTEVEQQLTDGTTVKHFLTKKGGMEAERLRWDQLPYRAGGHRLYADKFFVKQTVKGVQPDTGEEFLKPPAAYISGTKAEVVQWAKVMEKARHFVKYEMQDGQGLERLEEILSPITELKADDVYAMFKDGRLQLDSEFSPMFDRELPKEYVQATSPLDFVDIEETGFTGWLRTSGRMYYSSKGEALHDWQWERARTVDPFKATNESLNNIANIASFSDYKINSVDRWVNTYKEFLDTGGLPNNASPLTIFSEAKYRSNVDKLPMGAGTKIKQQMEAQRDIIRRNLGWRTDSDRYVDRYIQDARDFVMGSDPTSKRHLAGKAVVDWFEDRNPLSAMRGLAFDMKMGLFNAAQFPLQIQTMLAATALHPTHGFSAMVEIPAMRWYLSKGGNDAALPQLAKMLGYTEAETKDWTKMMQAGKKSGFFEFGGSHQLINTHGPNAVVGGFRGAWDQASQNMRFFFNEGEVWNRMVAWQIAWRETLDTATTKVGGNDFMRTVSLRADDYSMNMMSQSAASWQNGIASIPTQFWAYQARMLEAYGGKQFTTAQKLRLLVAQTFFYGAAGAPLVGVGSAFLKNRTGETPELNTPMGFLDRGMIDHVIFNGWGANVLAGKRYGTGSWLADTVGEIFGQSPYGEKSAFEIFGGATMSIMGQTGDTLLDTIKHAVAESGGEDYPLTKSDFERLAKNISTFSYAHKAYIAMQYNMYMSNKGTVVAKDLPTADAFFFALGLAPGEQDEVSAMMGFKKRKKEAVDEASKYISDQRTRMSIEVDRRNEIAAEVAAYTKLLPPDIRAEALKEANRRTPKTLHEGLAAQIEKEKAKREMLNGSVN